MLVIDSRSDLSDSLQRRISQLMPQELCVLRAQLQDQDLGNLLILTKAARQRTERVFLQVSEGSFDPVFLHALIRTGLSGAIVVFTTRQEPRPYHSVEEKYVGDLELLERVRKAKKSLPSGFRFIPGISIPQSKLNQIGAVLADLVVEESDSILLEVEGAPTSPAVLAIRNAFEYLRMRNLIATPIYFSFDNASRKAWELQTRCTFSGLEVVHMDVSNKCTHSCLFCGLYSPEIHAREKEKNQGKLPSQMIEMMRAELDPDKGLALIRDFPETVEMIQFGGAGDPLLHPYALDFIEAAAGRGFRLEVLSNLEYLDEKSLQRLKVLGRGADVRFIVNLGAATAATYTVIRPKQSEDVFRRVFYNIQALAEGGIKIIPMMVLNRLNFHEATDFVRLSKELGGASVYLKRMETHNELQYKLLAPETELRVQLSQALSIADALGIDVFSRRDVETSSDQRNVAADFYATNSCFIGYRYARFEVDGKVRPCCISKHPVGDLSKTGWKEIWHGGAYTSFRTKTESISETKFHQSDREWSFCQQCVHKDINGRANTVLV